MKIYISSTFEDLAEYRRKVYDQLRKMRHDVISMEDYTAGDQRPLAQCLADVASADIYVGLFAWRYGYVPPRGNRAKRSITELEYRHAVDSGKPCLIFLLERKQAWPPHFVDAVTGDGEKGESVKRLREELAERHMISWFTSPDDLASNVSAAVYRVQFDTHAPPAPAAAGAATLPPSTGGRHASPRRDFPGLWNPGDTLRVRFLDGSPRQRQLVRRFAPIWSAYANLHFDFNDAPDAELRVSFEQPGSWSYTGTDALLAVPEEPTVNFGWIEDGTRDTEADYTILHEFGHVLGLLHEHNNPAANIPWNKEAVYRAYEGPPNNWDHPTVDATFFSTWDPGRFPEEKPFDRESIMAFFLPSDFTSEGFEIAQNLSLSVTDKEFVGRLYPYEGAAAGEEQRRPVRRRARAKR